jgi:hypothetical protein
MDVAASAIIIFRIVISSSKRVREGVGGRVKLNEPQLVSTVNRQETLLTAARRRLAGKLPLTPDCCSLS